MYLTARLIEVVELNPRVKLYKAELNSPFSAEPGQFVMLWVPRVGEIPLSIANLKGKELWLIIARKGKVTSFIHENFKPGQRIFLRGPLGKGFTIKREGRCLLVAGGYGLAPLYFLARKLAELSVPCDALLGFRTAREVFFEKEFREICEKVYVSTDDGSYGYKGYVTDLLDYAVALRNYVAVYTSGKEAMMIKVVEECLEKGVYVEASLERLIRCGVGVCGCCSLDPLGLRVCRDGPVFSGEVLSKVSDFGKYWRDECGRKTAL